MAGMTDVKDSVKESTAETAQQAAELTKDSAVRAWEATVNALTDALAAASGAGGEAGRRGRGAARVLAGREAYPRHRSRLLAAFVFGMVAGVIAGWLVSENSDTLRERAEAVREKASESGNGAESPDEPDIEGTPPT
ncbi:MAG: hypothetical protein ACJ73S_22455 [Mycobacteriales bacterium]